jgi:Uncharacterized protein conserved in bacteria
MDMDWARLGRTFAAAREAAGLTQVEVAERIGVTRSPIQSIERGGVRNTPYKKVSSTMRSYARLLGWTSDSPDHILRGGEPSLLHVEPAATPVPEAGAVPETGRLPLRIVDELSDDGALLDTAVIPLSADASMVIVVKGRVDASPQEIRAALEAWRRAQPRLRELSIGQNRPPAASEA